MSDRNAQILLIRAEQLVGHAVDSIQQALHLPEFPAATRNDIITRSMQRVKGMDDAAKAALSPTSSTLYNIVAEAAKPSIGPEAAQRLMQQINERGYIGTGELPKSFGDESRFAGLSREALRNMERMRLAEQTTSGSMSEGVARNMMEARSLADRLGIGWAKESPELLKLGPSAIMALHDAGVEKSRFMRMTGKTVGFSAETAVEVAKFAKRHNLTPAETNNLYDNINKGAESLVKDKTPEEKLKIQRELDEATKKYMKGADSPEAREELNKAWQKHADTPEKKRDAEQATRAITAPTEQYNAVAAQTKADVAQAKTDSANKSAAAAATANKTAAPANKL